jgi:hypothetical protein
VVERFENLVGDRYLCGEFFNFNFNFLFIYYFFPVKKKNDLGGLMTKM